VAFEKGETYLQNETLDRLEVVHGDEFISTNIMCDTLLTMNSAVVARTRHVVLCIYLINFSHRNMCTEIIRHTYNS
jgi:hypothetical protein